MVVVRCCFKLLSSLFSCADSDSNKGSGTLEVTEDLNRDPTENLAHFLSILTESLFVLRKLPEAVEVCVYVCRLRCTHAVMIKFEIQRKEGGFRVWDLSTGRGGGEWGLCSFSYAAITGFFYHMLKLFLGHLYFLLGN